MGGVHIPVLSTSIAGKAEQMDVRETTDTDGLGLGGWILRLGFCSSLRRNLEGGLRGTCMVEEGQNVATDKHLGPPNFKSKDLEAIGTWQWWL